MEEGEIEGEEEGVVVMSSIFLDTVAGTIRSTYIPGRSISMGPSSPISTTCSASTMVSFIKSPS